MNQKKIRTSITNHCDKGMSPDVSMVDYMATAPEFVNIRLEIRNDYVINETQYFVKSEEECIAFRDSVVKACDALLARLELKREEKENEEK